MHMPILLCVFRRLGKISKREYYPRDVCLSVRPHENLVSHWTDFHEIWYLNIFRKSVEKKFNFSLKSNENGGYFTFRRVCIDNNISLSSS